MDDPIWITEQFAMAIHRRQLAEHGGLDGVRDAGMLSSALARPRNQFNYGDPTPSLAELAAAYAFGLAQPPIHRREQTHRRRRVRNVP
ncbi:MAG: hypothetical protein QM770_16750 [Tepidisphaeraceae bacterium]